MKLSSCLQLLLAQSAIALSLPSWSKKTLDQRPIKNDIPTVAESAAMARRMLRYEGIGTLSTVYPDNHPNNGVAGAPVGLMDYFADCEPSTGNPTLLGMTISTSFRNAAAGSNITLSLRWHRPGQTPYSAMQMPRFSLIGEVQMMDYRDVWEKRIPLCYGKTHPDATVWMPGNPIHESFWMRLIVREVYWLGGFGNQAYIGFIPLETYQGVTEKEIEEIRLPGEEEEQSLWSKVRGAFEF